MAAEESMKTVVNNIRLELLELQYCKAYDDIDTAKLEELKPQLDVAFRLAGRHPGYDIYIYMREIAARRDASLAFYQRELRNENTCHGSPANE
jgi:hypothetical protein